MKETGDEVVLSFSMNEKQVKKWCTEIYKKAKRCEFKVVFSDQIMVREEDSFVLKLFETTSVETIDMDIDFVKKNLGCSGNCQDLVGGFTELFICSDTSCATSMANTDPLIVKAGDNITVVVIITVDALAKSNTLIIDSLTLADSAGTE